MLNTEHPFLIKMECVFQSNTRVYFCMPYIPSEELYSILKRHKILTEEVVQFFSVQLALAIGELHEKGFVHRDLKLENILVNQKGYLKVIDYGLANIIIENEANTTFCGTLEYQAPEMILGCGYDKNVDWWAFGILLYEMKFGCTPFYHPNRQQLLARIKLKQLTFPDRSKYAVAYSNSFEDLVKKLLVKDPKERLGAKNGLSDILAHSFFAEIDPSKVLKFEIQSPGFGFA